MKVRLISFCGKPKTNPYNRNYKKEVERLFYSAKNVGLDTKEYNNEWLEKTNEYKDNPLTFSHRAYAWAFKSLAILDTFNDLEEGDIVIWSDSNHIVLEYPIDIIDVATKNSIFVHDHYPAIYYNRNWTNKQLFIKTGCDSEEYHNAIHLHANICAFIKNDFTLNFVKEWKKLNCDYKVSIDTSEFINSPEVIDNRYDQSILSILAVKYNIPVQKCYEKSIAEISQLYEE